MRFLLLSLALPLGACGSSPRGPVIASSSGQATYAVAYSAELDDATRRVSNDEATAKSLAAGLAAQPGKLEKPDWNVVRAVVDDSDAAGKSQDFVDAHGDQKAVRDFWTDEKDPITRSVAGNAQYAAQHANCTGADVAGAVSYSLDDGFSKAIRERLRAHDEAQVVIDRRAAALGKEDTAALEKLEDDVAEASYLVHVDIVEQRERVRRLLGDADAVKKTLDRFVQEEASYQAEPGRTDAEKKASQARVEAANKSRAKIDGAVEQANAAMKDVDARIDAATKDYEDKLKALRDDVASRTTKPRA